MANARERIVVIESDAATRDALQAAMQGAGYDAAPCATFQEGLDAIHASGADLLLLDSRMPDLNARGALATIRGSAATEALRVILLVGSSAEERAAAIDLGADDAISRPSNRVSFWRESALNCARCGPKQRCGRKRESLKKGSRSRIRHSKLWR